MSSWRLESCVWRCFSYRASELGVGTVLTMMAGWVFLERGVFRCRRLLVDEG